MVKLKTSELLQQIQVLIVQLYIFILQLYIYITGMFVKSRIFLSYKSSVLAGGAT